MSDPIDYTEALLIICLNEDPALALHAFVEQEKEAAVHNKHMEWVVKTEALLAEWAEDCTTYPIESDFAAEVAETMLRMCMKELHDALLTTKTKEAPDHE